MSGDARDAPAATATVATEMLHQRMRALSEGCLPLSDWDAQFVDSVCYRSTCATTPRQQHMIAILCWRHRAHLPPELVPAAEPPQLKARA